MASTELEDRKLKLEIDALERGASAKWQWLLPIKDISIIFGILSVIIGIVFSFFQVYATLKDIGAKERQLIDESAVRTKKLYLSLLEGITGAPETNRGIQLAIYDTTIALGKDFPKLQPLVTASLLRQICQTDKNKFPEEEEIYLQLLTKLKWKSTDPRYDPAVPDTLCPKASK